MKRKHISILLTLALVVCLIATIGIFASAQEDGQGTVTFAPYTDADGVRQYCACGNKFVKDENGTIAYVNGEDGCKNHKDENGVVVDGCDGTLITWKPCDFNLSSSNESAYTVAEDGTVSGMAYYLTKDVKSGSQQFGTDAGNYYLDLNGFSFTRSNVRVITPQENVHLYITDTSAEKDGYIACVDTNDTPMTGQGCTIWFRYGNSTVTLYDGTIDGSQENPTSNAGGASIYSSDSNTGNRVSQFGGTIISGNGPAGRGGFMMGNGVYNLYDGNVVGGSGKNGGALYIGTNAIFIMYGGSITGGESTGNGGSVHSNGTIYIYDGSISGGTAGAYGDILNLANGSCTITGGTIGKGVHDGIYMQSDSGCVLTIGGDAQIADLKINGEHTFTTNADFSGSVGLTLVNKNHVVTTLDNVQQIACFTSNEEGYTTKTTGSLGILVNDDPVHASHCICGGYAEGKGDHACEDATWQAWGYLEAEKTSFPTVSGNYYLVADIAITSTKNVAATEQVNLCLNGHTVNMSKTGRINVRKGVSVTDCGTGGQILSSVESTSSATYRCVFYVYNGATVDLYNAIIDARASKVADGAIAHIGNDAAAYLNIYAGTYYGATLTLDGHALAQTRGGAFNITATSVMNMYGGQIIGGESTDAQEGKVAIGGCVAIYSGTLNMFGGSIAQGKANSVYLRYNSTCHLNLSGDAIIDDLYVDGAKKFTVSEDFAGSVGLTVATKNHEVVTLKNAQQAACFTSNEEGYTTKTTGSLGVLVNDDPAHANHCVCGGHGAGKGDHTCEAATWQAWGYLEAEKTSLPTASGNYYLVADVSLAAAASLEASADISLCLNGHNITGTGTNRIFAVRNHLAVTDCSENPGTVSATYSGNYGGIFFVYQNATVDIYAGIWDASQGNAAQGGIAIIGNSAAGTMNIYGGTFYGSDLNKEMADREARGGAFYMIASSKLNIYDGTIHGGSAVCGGVVYVNAGTVSMYGGLLTGGTADLGGSVYINSGSFNLYDGEVTGGQAQYGGNFYVSEGKTLSVQGGQITNGLAHHDTEEAQGGNIYSEADITLENCVISGGKATSGTVDAEGAFVAGGTTSGGNIMAVAKLTMTGCTVSNGEATHGGNIRMEKTTNLTNCTVSGGKATLMCDGTTNGNGGNIYSTSTAQTTLDGCTITGGEGQRGGSIGAWGKVTLIDTSVTGGHANVNGGNIMTYNAGYVILQGSTVISGGTATGNGGNIATSSAASKTNTIEDGVQVIGGAADGLGDCIFVSGGKLKLKGAPVITGIFANNSDSAYGMDVSELNVTTPIHLGVNKLGVVAATTSDNSAMFTLAQANKELRYDSDSGQLIYSYREIENVYVDVTNGNDDNTGVESAPVKTFAQAMNLVKNNGTIHLVGTVQVESWSAHNKTFVITGGELVLPETRVNLWDNVTFTDVTITMTMCTTNTSSNYGSYFFYCNGFKTVFEEDVVIQYSFNGEITTNPYRSLTYLKNGVETAITATSTIYGGGPSATGVLTGTDLTILGGLWGNVYGGSNGVDIEGDVHLTVGGKINEGVDYVSHTISSRHIILGGSRAADITGTVYMNVTGGMYHTSTHGGSNSGTVGNIEMRVTGGRGMALYGGGRSGGVLTVTGEANFYLEGGEWEQVFGGTLSNCQVGTVNLHVTGGKITRRLYGGCYSNCSESSGEWTADNFVTGDVNLYIGSDAEITCDLKDPNAGLEAIITGGKYSDRGIYGHSRRAAPGANDAENARIIFLDQAAYNKHKGNLKAQDTIMSSIMKGVTAADYICYLGTNASGNVITVGATEVEDNVNNALDLPSATATVAVADGPYYYEGAALTPATVTYSDGWTYGDLEIVYTNNNQVGTATASITYEGVTASTSFTIEEKPCEHTNTTTAYAQVEGSETHTITVTCECGEVIRTEIADCTDENKDYTCDLCEGALAKPVAQVGENQYTSLVEAIAHANGNAVQLLADCGDVTVESDLYIDLNGFNLTGITVAEGAKLYLIDSATNDFEGAYGTAAVTGSVETFVEYGDKDYLVVAENGLYSAHCYEVKLTHVSLDPANDALGYKAQFFGDEIVQAHVKSFGFNMSVAGGLSKTYTKDAADFDGTFTLRLKGIMAANGGEMAITGSAFVIFDGEDQTVTTDAHSTTMKDTVESVNESFDSYSAEQQAAVKAMVIKYASKMEDWNIDKIKPE